MDLPRRPEQVASWDGEDREDNALLLLLRAL
jgi:hypothetical protein